MKFLISEMAAIVAPRKGRRNRRVFFSFVGLLTVMIIGYSILFHLLMEREGREFSPFTGLYWTLSTMSTLGYGDITFDGDLGKIFSVVVLVSGVVFLLVVFPFTFIEFFYAPWVEAQNAARVPKQVDEAISGHVILNTFGPVANNLIKKLDQYHYPYVLVVPDLDETLRLHDMGLNVVFGDLDNPETYERLRVDRAALVATMGNDPLNTSVAFTVRELSNDVTIIATASDTASVDILKLAGCTHVVLLANLMGQSLARRTPGGDARAHIIGHFDKLLIAEASVAETPLVGQTIESCRLRNLAGVTIVGVWERGKFESARLDTKISEHTVLVLAGTQAQLKKYDELFCIYQASDAPVVIIGGGRVGRATGRALERRKIDYRIVEQLPERIRDPDHYVLGNAAELEVLEQAGIMQSPAVIITTHDDATNIYLTIYCRRLRPDIRIISRSTRERNISTLHRAGADFVMSYASMGANIIFNLLKKTSILMVAEGLNLFRVAVTPSLVGRTIAETSIRGETGATVMAIIVEGEMNVNPEPEELFPEGGEIILIGDVEAEDRFLKRYGGETE